MNEDLAILAGDGQLPVLLDLEMPAATFVVFEGMPHQLQKKRINFCKVRKAWRTVCNIKTTRYQACSIRWFYVTTSSSF